MGGGGKRPTPVRSSSTGMWQTAHRWRSAAAARQKKTLCGRAAVSSTAPPATESRDGPVRSECSGTGRAEQRKAAAATGVGSGGGRDDGVAAPLAAPVPAASPLESVERGRAPPAAGARRLRPLALRAVPRRLAEDALPPRHPHATYSTVHSSPTVRIGAYRLVPWRKECWRAARRPIPDGSRRCRPRRRRETKTPIPLRPHSGVLQLYSPRRDQEVSDILR